MLLKIQGLQQTLKKIWHRFGVETDAARTNPNNQGENLNTTKDLQNS